MRTNYLPNIPKVEKPTDEDILCLSCKLKAALCDCKSHNLHVHLPDHVFPPKHYSRSKWIIFLKQSRNVFRRKYLMCKNKELKEAIELLYLDHNLIDVFESTTVLRKSPEKPESSENYTSLDTGFEITVSEDAIAKYGSGLYMRLMFELSAAGDTYETLYLRLKGKENTATVKAYNRLVKKIKKITGYTFNLIPVMITQSSERAFAKPTKRPIMMWATSFKLPPGMRKIDGEKNMIFRDGAFYRKIKKIQ